MLKMKYKEDDKDSIYLYGKELIGKSFNNIIGDNLESFIIEEPHPIYNIDHKGGLGDIVQEHHFGMKPDSRAEADFPKADLELKVTPFKINKNNTISAKERLSLSMINFHDIIENDFFQSNVWEKIENILLVYYEWKKEIERLDYIIKYVYLYSPTTEDLEIIKRDYNKIRSKVEKGLAHELSERDTMYLGASPKGRNARDVVTQPESDIMAMKRGFSFKSSYMTNLLRNYIKPSHDAESVVKNVVFEDFEEYITNKINSFSDQKIEDLFKIHFDGKIPTAKNKYSLLINRLLGVKTKYIDEFEKANIQIKTIRRQKNGKVKESMSFPAFNIIEFINEEWEESELYSMFMETKFLFVVFDETNDGFRLSGSMFWKMTEEMINTTLKEEWELAKKIFTDGIILTPTIQRNNKIVVKNNLPTKAETEITHVRPHASLSYYVINDMRYGSGKLTHTDLLPNGDRMVKQCFWLNNNFIKKIIKEI